jgi:hypothetical protein
MLTIYRDSILVNPLSPRLCVRHRNPSTSELVQQGHAALRRAVEKPVISSLGRRPTCTARDNTRLPEEPTRSISGASPAHRRGNVGEGVDHSVHLSVRWIWKSSVEPSSPRLSSSTAPVAASVDQCPHQLTPPTTLAAQRPRQPRAGAASAPRRGSATGKRGGPGYSAMTSGSYGAEVHDVDLGESGVVPGDGA